jgi:hypothetical protein
LKLYSPHENDGSTLVACLHYIFPTLSLGAPSIAKFSYSYGPG